MPQDWFANLMNSFLLDLMANLPPVQAILWTGNTAAAAFGSLIAAGIYARLDGRKDWGGWRW